MSHRKKIIKYSALSAIVLILMIAGFFIWLYTGKFNTAKGKVLAALPAPIAYVGSHPVYYKDFSTRYDISSKLNTQNPPLDSQSLKQAVLDNLIAEQRIKEAAAKHGVSVGSKELDSEYAVLVQKTSLPNGQSFDDFLKGYGLSRSTFKNLILKQQLLSTKLAVWFNSQKDLNPQSFKTADELQGKLSGGADFAELAKTYSQEPTSRSLEGDMGFVQVSDLLPELSEPVDSMNVGQTKLMASRYGLHLVKMVEKNNNGPQGTAQVHLNQIFIKSNDFEQWLNKETKDLNVKILINPVN